MREMKKLLTYMLIAASFMVMTEVSAQSSEDIEKGRIRIKLKEDYLKELGVIAPTVMGSDKLTTGIIRIDELSKQTNIIRIERVFPFSLKNETKHMQYGLHLWFELKFDDSIDPTAIAEQYSFLEEVEIAKPVYKKINIDELDPGYKEVWSTDVLTDSIKVDTLRSNGAKFSQQSSARITDSGSARIATYNDPYIADQWHYNNDGTVVGEAGYDIDLFNAWTIATGSSDIVVAVVDGGIDIEHEDLADNIWINEAELNGEAGVDDDQNGYVDDINGYNFIFGGNITDHAHGTHVAGTVGAVTNNGLGVAGVAGGDGSGNGVRLMSCQVFDNRSGGGGNFAGAIVYGADNGALISQNSWGYTSPGYFEPEVYDAIKYFIAEAGQYEGSPMKGGILFFASGNTGANETHYPATFDEVVAVGATGPTGEIAPYSTHGAWVDLTAPGGDPTFGMAGGILSTLPGSNYGYMSGTSMATPHVSGVAALVIQKFGGDSFRAEDLRNIMLGSTTPFDWDHQELHGSGILNALNALSEDERIAPEAITDLAAIDVFHNELTLQWTVPTDEDNFQPYYFYLALSESEITEENFDQQPRLFQLTNGFEAGVEVNILVNGLRQETDYWFAIKSADRFFNTSDISNILNATTTSPPIFTESTRSIELEIDFSQDSLVTTPVTFSNTGEGVIYWNSFTVNESAFSMSMEDWSYAQTSQISSAVSTPQLFFETMPTSVDGTSVNDADFVVELPEYLSNDNTQTISGLSYATGAGSLLLSGSGTPNAGLIFATQYHIPRDFTFNLTHIQVALYMTQKEQPIIVELKKGSRNNVEEAETVYVQEYYTDTTNVLMYHRIPIYQPQRFEDDEYFYIVFHFPQQEDYPMVLERAYYSEDLTGYFMKSSNKGVSFEDAYRSHGRIYPLVNALSSGNDGAYVFLDPVEGELAAGESEEVNITVDATFLTNGNHLATVGINTNDINKPGVSIEIKTVVTGQLPEVDFVEDLYELNAYVGIDNEYEIQFDNIGYGNLVVYDVQSASLGFSKNFEADSLIYMRGQSKIMAFKYNPAVPGTVFTKVKLVTNIGDVAFNVRIIAIDRPTIEVSILESNYSMVYDETAEIALKIKNTGTSSLLNYDLTHYDFAASEAGRLSESLRYTISSSDDLGGPLANQWDEILDVGTHYVRSQMRWTLYELDIEFPFYDQIMHSLLVDGPGALAFNNYGGFVNDSTEIARGLLAPLDGINARVQNLYHYSYGDRDVFTIEMTFNTGIHISPENIPYFLQIILFRDGAIEYRYQGVDESLSGDEDYKIGVQGLSPSDTLIYREYGETAISVHNGLVVRFEPEAGSSINMIYSTSSEEGAIMPGDSVTVNLILKPSAFNVLPGSYQNNVAVKSNATTPEVLLPLNITISEDIALFVAADSLTYDSVRLGQEKVLRLKIENEGVSAGNISAISFGNSDFSFQGSLPYAINGRAHELLPITFTPTSTNAVNTIMTIDFDNGQSATAVITGMGDIDPEYTIAIASNIEVNLHNGESAIIPFTVTNFDKGVDLEYTFKNSTFTKVSTDGILNGVGVNNDFVIDKYGYSWHISDSLKTFHRWKDISDNAEVIPVEYEQQKPIVLPFEFPFYGQLYDTIWVSQKGYVSISKPEHDAPLHEFKAGDGVIGTIAPFYANLVFTNEGLLYFEEEDRVFLQWVSQGEIPSNEPGLPVFQLELVSDGSIYFHYNQISDWGGIVNYGLESPDETETVGGPIPWIMLWAKITDSTTVAMRPPLKDNLLSNEERSFSLEISSERIYYEGQYQDTVVFYTNSGVQPVYKIPVTINVTGEPLLEATDGIVLDDVILSQETTRKIKLTNVGYATLEINNITKDQLPGVELINPSGNKIITNSTGQMLSPIELKPWDEVEIEVILVGEQLGEVSGTIHLGGDFVPIAITVQGNVVESPIFAWDATNQDLAVNYSDGYDYTFTIENQGETPLEYNLLPGVKPNTSGPVDPIVTETGHYSFEQPFTMDSLAWDTKHEADGVFSPRIGVDLEFANGFTAPAGGFSITHIASYTNFREKKEYIKVSIYLGGDEPNSGELIYFQNYEIDQVVSSEWVYFPMEFPVVIPEGEKFWLQIDQPYNTSYKLQGFEFVDDEIAKNSYIGNSYGGLKNEEPIAAGYVWKIRPLTAAGEGQWLTVDPLSGTLGGGESTTITASVLPEFAETGINKGVVGVRTNDTNTPNDLFNVQVVINGAPEIAFSPNQYQDTLRIVETNELIANYLFNDPEGEDVTITLINENEAIEVEFEQNSANTARVKFETNYESEGVYHYPVEIVDVAGNVTSDTIWLEVKNKNRAPELNPEFASITLNLADPSEVFSISSQELFIDPDGDDLQLLAGNYTPDIVDLALGGTYIDLHALTEGVGYVVFGADDGKENGFVIYGVYVYVINDPSLVGSSTDGTDQEDDLEAELLLRPGEMMTLYPNPVVNNKVNIAFKLKEDAHVVVEIYNVDGRKVGTGLDKWLEADIYDEPLDVSEIQTGFYICRFRANDTVIRTAKMIIK